MKYIDNKTFEPVPGATIQFLKANGIEDVESFLYKPKPSDYESPWDMQNMRALVDELHKGFEDNKTFFLQVDSDTDGITSSSIFYNYFKSLYPYAKILYRVHDGKEHGVIVDTVPVDADYVVIPDAGSNQIEEHEELTRKGYKVLVMDHHLMEYKSDNPDVIIVNNQDGSYHNRQLSGAGVVYKTIQAYAQIYAPNSNWKLYEDLAALGIIADCMDCRTLDNNAIVTDGLAHIENPMFSEILERQSAGGLKIKDTSNPTKIDLAFYVAPLVNAVIRSGSIEDKTQLFEGFIGVGADQTFEHDFRGTHYEENLYQYIARCAVNLRAKQNRIKEKSLAAMDAIVEKEHLNDNKVLILKVGAEIVDKNITGLVAMDMVNKYGKPALVLRPVVENEDGERVVYYRGSGRAQLADGFTDFMAVLQESGLMEYVQGHENAFGASVKESDIPALTEFLNKRLADIEFVLTPSVDCCMDDDNWNNIVLKEFGGLEKIYGNGIPEARFHVEFDAKVGDFKVQGKNANSLKISHKGIALIAFNCTDIIDSYQKIVKENPEHDVHVEAIGVPSINSYMGYDNIQIMIKDIELSCGQYRKSSLF